MDGKVRNRLERAQVSVLTDGTLRIITGACTDLGGEVPDSVDVVFGEWPAAQRIEVEPLVARPLQAAVVQVETVNVDVDAHGNSGYGRGRRARRRYAGPRNWAAMRSKAHVIGSRQGGGEASR